MIREVLLAAAVILTAGEAAACTLFYPRPAPGETLEQSVYRRERAYQAHLQSSVDLIYLARIVRSGPRRFRFEPVVSMKGPRPPRFVFVQTINCEAEPQPGELRVVFADRLGRDEFPHDYWAWNRIGVRDSIPPGRVWDGNLAASLRRAADRIRR